MKQFNKIITIFLIVTLLIPTLCPFSKVFATNAEEELDKLIQTKGPSQEQRDYLASYVRTYLKEAHKMTPRPFIYDSINGGYENHYHQNEWNTTELGQHGTNEFGTTYNNVMRTVCSVFTAAMLHQAWGVEIYSPEVTPTYRGAGYANPLGRGKDIFNKVQDSEPLLPGDIISWSDYGHSMIYIGCDPETGRHQVAQTCGGTEIIGIRNMRGVPDAFNNKVLTAEQAREFGGTYEGGVVNYAYFSRIKPELLEGWTKPAITYIQWPNGSITEWDGEGVSTVVDTSVPLFYSGIATPIGALGVQSKIKNIFEAINDIFDYLTGLITMIIRIPLVGITRSIEWLVTSVVQVISTEPIEYALTLEDIVYNKVPFFDINLFNTNNAGGETIESDNITFALRQNIALWYYAFRNLIIAALLVVLLYLGIRMAITSIAEEKAEYKRMIVDWFISFFIVLFIHYFIIAVYTLNDFFVGELFKQGQNTNMGSLYENVRVLAHSAKFTDGWYGTIMYIALVWYMAKYAWKYAKRLLSAFILVMLSPLVGISYAIDKIKDNRSQSLGRWLKEIAFTALIQSAHALIYTVFMVGIVSTITTNNNMLQCIGSCVFLVLAVNFMDATEDIFETIFGFKKSSNVKEVMNNAFEMIAKLKLAKEVVKGYYKFGKGVVKGTVGVTNKTAEILAPKVPAIKRWQERKEQFNEGYKEGIAGINSKKVIKAKITEKPGITAIRREINLEQNRQQQILNKESATAKDTYKTTTGIIKNAYQAGPMLLKNPLSLIAYVASTGVMTKKMVQTLKRNGYKMR